MCVRVCVCVCMCACVCLCCVYVCECANMRLYVLMFGSGALNYRRSCGSLPVLDYVFAMDVVVRSVFDLRITF